VTLFIDGKQVDQKSGIRSAPGDPTLVSFDMKAAKAEEAPKQAAMQKALETGQITPELDRSMTPEQKAALKKQIEEHAGAMKKKEELNGAFGAGMTALQAQQYDQAIEQFNKAGELDPAQVAVWSHMADAYMGLADTKTGAEHDAALQKVLEAYGKAIALKPEEAGLHNNYALALAKAGKGAEAEAEIEKAVQAEPTAACKYYYNLGALLTNASQADAANIAFTKAVTADKTCADAYYQIGVNLLAKATTAPDGKVIAAPGTVEAIQKYLELQPTGKFSNEAKGTLEMLGSTIETSYKNAADAKKKKKN
jgi:Tfp pilus assembly protein PilF